MTRVRLIGKDEYDLREELRSSETSRRALSTYEFKYTPLDNVVEVETATIGAGLALLNDLNWYVRRYCRAAELLDPEVSEEEWLSRELARKLYETEMEPEDTREYLKVRGVREGELLEPLYAREEPPEYDLAESEYSVVTRIDETEFRR